MKAKKSYGQHFLIDQSVSEGIANAINPAYKNILEVGPGTGMLTQHLIKLDRNLKLVEADRDMSSVIRSKWPILNRNLIEMDFLKYDLAKAFNGESFALVGNYPYNISSQIVFKMIENRAYVPEMIGMFQKEVGERIIADPGSKKYGVISILTQAYYSGSFIFHVPPESFNPPPKVDSIVIKLVRNELAYEDYDASLFKHIVKSAFNQRRKMLRNTMKGIISDKTFLEDPMFIKRPEQLSVQDFIRLTNKVTIFRENQTQH